MKDTTVVSISVAPVEPLEANFTAADGTVDREAYRAAHDEWFDNWQPPPDGCAIANGSGRINTFTEADTDADEAFDRAVPGSAEAMAAVALIEAGDRRRDREHEAVLRDRNHSAAGRLFRPMARRTMTRARGNLRSTSRPSCSRRSRSTTSSSSSSDSPPGDSDGPGERPRQLPLLAGRDRHHVEALARIGVVA
jgi:hypothetical protein